MSIIMVQSKRNKYNNYKNFWLWSKYNNLYNEAMHAWLCALHTKHMQAEFHTHRHRHRIIKFKEEQVFTGAGAELAYVRTGRKWLEIDQNGSKKSTCSCFWFCRIESEQHIIISRRHFIPKKKLLELLVNDIEPWHHTGHGNESWCEAFHEMNGTLSSNNVEHDSREGECFSTYMH